MVNALYQVVSIQIVPAVGVVGHDFRARCNVVSHVAVSPRYSAEVRSANLSIAQTNHDYALALATLIADQPAVTTVLSVVRRLDVAAEIRSIDLNDLANSAKLIAFHLGRHRFTQIESQEPQCLMLNAKIAAQRQNRVTIHLVTEDYDGGEQLRNGIVRTRTSAELDWLARTTPRGSG